MTASIVNPRYSGLRCFACEREHDFRSPQTVCSACGMPLRVDYDLERGTLPLTELEGDSLWRYRKVLPLVAGEVSLSEGRTPLLAIDQHLFVKDEARNPTGSFKARGM